MRKARVVLAAGVTVSILGLAPLDAEAAPAGVVINEIESQAGSPDDWVELYNPGGEQVDLAGYVLSDNSDDHRWVLPAGTVLAPGAFHVVDIAAVEGGFGLGGADSVRLFAPDGATLVDSHAWTQHSPTSIARCPDGSGALRDSLAPTKGAANSCAEPALPAVVINEQLELGARRLHRTAQHRRDPGRPRGLPDQGRR